MTEEKKIINVEMKMQWFVCNLKRIFDDLNNEHRCCLLMQEEKYLYINEHFHAIEKINNLNNSIETKDNRIYIFPENNVVPSKDLFVLIIGKSWLRSGFEYYNNENKSDYVPRWYRCWYDILIDKYEPFAPFLE